MGDCGGFGEGVAGVVCDIYVSVSVFGGGGGFEDWGGGNILKMECGKGFWAGAEV